MTLDNGMDHEYVLAHKALGGVGIPEKQKVARMKAGMQITKEWMERNGVWELFIGDFPQAKEWFK